MIGDLKYKVTLQQPVLTGDGGGGFTESWQNVASTPTVYADIAPLSGGERLRFHQQETFVTHRITLRYRGDLTNAMRLVRGERIYTILSITDRDGRGIWLDILAAETNTV